MRLDAENWNHLRSGHHHGRGKRRRTVFHSHRTRSDVIETDRFEACRDGLPVAGVEVIDLGNVSHVRNGGAEPHQLPGPRERQRPEEHSLHHTEDRCTRADTKRDRQNDRDGEDRGSAARPPSVAEISGEVLKHAWSRFTLDCRDGRHQCSRQDRGAPADQRWRGEPNLLPIPPTCRRDAGCGGNVFEFFREIVDEEPMVLSSGQ